MKGKLFLASKRKLLWSSIALWLVLLAVLQPTVGTGGSRTQTTTVTEYTTVTITETEEETVTLIRTSTVTGTRVEESVYETYVTIIIPVIVPSRTFRVETFTTSTRRYWTTTIDGDVVTGGEGWVYAAKTTVYYIVPVTVLMPTRVGTLRTKLVTITESRESPYTVESATTHTRFITRTFTRTYESKYVEEFEETREEARATISLPSSYILYGLIAAVAAIAAALTLTRRRRYRPEAAVSYCINCGAPIPIGSKFCPKCGEPQKT